jgi:hypothetical protein
LILRNSENVICQSDPGATAQGQQLQLALGQSLAAAGIGVLAVSMRGKEFQSFTKLSERNMKILCKLS